MSIAKATAAGCVVFREIQRKNFEYLLLKCSRAQHWTPPKGHLDPGEDEKTAASREVREESGLGVDDYEILNGFEKTLSYKASGKDKTVKYWLARLKNVDAKVTLSHEHSDFAWFNVKKMDDGGYKNCILHDDTKRLLKAADEFLNNLHQ